MTQQPVIQVRDVSQQAGGGRLILRGVSLAVARGELVAIIGGSGTGKTTLLNTLCGLAPQAAGDIFHDGVAGPFGYVPQDDIIHPGLPLRRTLHYAARLRLPAGHQPRRSPTRSAACWPNSTSPATPTSRSGH